LIRTDPQEAARVCGDLDVGYHVLNDIPEPDLIAAYDRALALVVPSYREGMCIPLVEAAARGTPSVASDLPQMREIVGDGPTGVLVPGYNPVNWADVMEKLLTGQEAWMRFSRAGTSSAETYSMARIAAKVDEILQEIVRNRGER
jgi:D-inositol-3-phosphate glycosyltransferase